MLVLIGAAALGGLIVHHFTQRPHVVVVHHYEPAPLPPGAPRPPLVVVERH